MQTALPRIRKAQFFSMIRMYETSAANQRAAVRADMDGSGKLTLFDRIEESLEIKIQNYSQCPIFDIQKVF